jgi:hypothetical protein
MNTQTSGRGRTTSMFDVDRVGLRKLLERRGLQFALYELVQNAWDQNVREVRVTFVKPPGSRVADLSVTDDDPDGFADLADAYTLFAESYKKANPRQRGRFNIGEKLVIALCEESRIVTTKGGVEFVGNERKSLRRHTDAGSVFEGKLRITSDEFAVCCEAMKRLIPPEGISTYFNGILLEPRKPVATIEKLSLATEIADADGYLRRSTRQTDVRIFEPMADEVGMLYELGIPVVETGDDFHVDVGQKVPLTMDRDNVPPAFLRSIRTAVLNKMHPVITEETANHVWVKQAMEDPDASDDAIRTVIRHRFGDQVASYDPRDPEASNRAVANGFTVVHGRNLSKDEWANVRRVGGIPSAGQLFPTHSGEAKNATKLEPSVQEAKMIAAIKRLSKALFGFEVSVGIVSDMSFGFSACYGGREMLINRARVGKAWFDELDERSVGLIIHELGHELSSNHLSDEYYRALTKLGARLAIATAKDPSLLVL